MFKVITIALVACLLFFSQQAQAEQKLSPEMEIAEKKINSLEGLERCVETWNTLWPLAKKGDLQARMALVWNVMPMIHMDMVIPPGRTGDYVSRMRDVQILLVHSLGDWMKAADVAMDIGMFDFVFSSILSEEFDKCISEKRYGECAVIAVEEKRIPSFADYTAELDALVAQGFKPTCEEDGYNQRMRKIKE